MPLDDTEITNAREVIDAMQQAFERKQQHEADAKLGAMVRRMNGVSSNLTIALEYCMGSWCVTGNDGKRLTAYLETPEAALLAAGVSDE